MPDPDDPLHEFNYAHFSRAALAQWPELDGVVRRLRELNSSGQWRGEYLVQLIAELAPTATPD